LEIWLTLLATLSTGFVTIKIINYTSKAIQHFVYGRKTQSPSMNMLSIMLGITQPHVPSRKFARMLLLLFLIFSLLMRTAYQDKMFKFMKSEPRRREIATIDEAMEKNFTFYLLNKLIDDLRGSDFLKR